MAISSHNLLHNGVYHATFFEHVEDAVYLPMCHDKSCLSHLFIVVCFVSTYITWCCCTPQECNNIHPKV